MEANAELGLRLLYVPCKGVDSEMFAGDGGSVKRPLTQNFVFDYLLMCVKLLSDWQTVQNLIRCSRMHI